MQSQKTIKTYKMSKEKLGWKSGAKNGAVIGSCATVGMLVGGPIGLGVGTGVGIAINLLRMNNKNENTPSKKGKYRM